MKTARFLLQGKVKYQHRPQRSSHRRRTFRGSIRGSQYDLPKQVCDVRFGQLGLGCAVTLPEHGGKRTFLVLKAEYLFLDRTFGYEAMDKDGSGRSGAHDRWPALRPQGSTRDRTR